MLGHSRQVVEVILCDSGSEEDGGEEGWARLPLAGVYAQVDRRGYP